MSDSQTAPDTTGTEPGAAEPWALSEDQLDDLLAHPYWEQLDEPLHGYVSSLPQIADRIERTTMLNWIYLNSGAMTFDDLADRILHPENISARKKSLRRVLRIMAGLNLVTVVNFGEDFKSEEELAQADENADQEVIGRNSLVSLTWTGMVWMRRAWAARARLMRGNPDRAEAIHQMMVEEEDDGRATEPVWVENLSTVDPDLREMRDRQRETQKRKPVANSVFDLASAMR